MAGSELDIQKLAVNPYAQPKAQIEQSIWTPKQKELIDKTVGIQKVNLNTALVEKPFNEKGFEKRTIIDILNPKSKSDPKEIVKDDPMDIATDNDAAPIAAPKDASKTEDTFTKEDITVEATEEAYQEVARKIIKNDDRIDEIFNKMQELDTRMKEIDDLINTATTPLEREIRKKVRERLQLQMDDLLDELIVRSTMSYCQLTQEDIFRVRKLIRDDVEQLQSAMKDKTTMIIICVSGAISIGGAGLGFAPGGIMGFSAAQVKAATNMSQSIGQGGSLLAQQNMQSAQGRQKVLQDLFVTVDQNVERDRGDAKSKAHNLVVQLIEAIRAKYKERHNAWQAVNN